MFRLSFVFVLFISIISFAQDKKPMSVEDLWKMKRIGTFDVSPDGRQIAFSVTSYKIDKNKGNTDIYLINTDGSNLRALKNSEKNESEPKFTPDGKKIAYVMDDQIWLCNIDGRKDVQLTKIYTGASGLVWSPDGSRFLFVSSVYPDCETQDCNEAKDKAKDTSKVKAEIFTGLMYRHWDHWRGEKRSHLFLFDMKTKSASDLTLNSSFDVPPIDLGSDRDYSFSPDGNEVAFTTNMAETLAISTNNDIFLIDMNSLKAGKAAEYKKVSQSSGNDHQPVYSPDSSYIAFLSMARAGFEADKKRVMIYNRKTGELKSLTDKFDRSADHIVWSPDSKFIYFTAANEIYSSVYKLDISTEQVRMILANTYTTSPVVTSNGRSIIFKQQKSTMPYELFSMSDNGANVKRLTNLNKDVLDKIEFGSLETIWYEGAERSTVQAIIVRPPFFDPSKKYPMMFLIHGGPQGHWSDDFHFRWNIQMFAAKGYIVVAPNPRGSTGYGQQFTDEISQDWGGKPYIDLMNCYDYVINNYDYVDKNNTFAAGASYGGYMINWIEGHTDRFSALVCHDGVFNLESMYGTTEELWFTDWEFGGAPWQNRDLYKKWSPHQYVENFRTPMLVVHGAKDFRVPEEQAFQLFTSLQRMGVESEFLYFPDETHFVSKPQNSLLWWNTIFNWFDKFKKGQSDERTQSIYRQHNN